MSTKKDDDDDLYPSQYTVEIESEHEMSRSVAAHLLDTHILPVTDKGYRMNLNNHDNDDDDTNDIMDSSSTYGEFSLSSLDIILDRLIQELRHEASNTSIRRPLNIVDIGSGCGRLLLYMAMTTTMMHESFQKYYDEVKFTGIEQSKALHEEAIRATERLQLQRSNNDNDNIDNHFLDPKDHSGKKFKKTIQLYHGNANDYMNDEIYTADIIICYSTAFASSGVFLPSISALILSDEWNTILTPPVHTTSSSTTTTTTTTEKKVLYCVTMDKALDPLRGWIMVDHISVPNPEIGVNSIAYIQKIYR